MWHSLSIILLFLALNAGIAEEPNSVEKPIYANPVITALSGNRQHEAIVHSILQDGYEKLIAQEDGAVLGNRSIVAAFEDKSEILMNKEEFQTIAERHTQLDPLKRKAVISQEVASIMATRTIEVMTRHDPRGMEPLGNSDSGPKNLRNWQLINRVLMEPIQPNVAKLQALVAEQKSTIEQLEFEKGQLVERIKRHEEEYAKVAATYRELMVVAKKLQSDLEACRKK